MRDTRNHVERAAAGLVIALFLAVALLVGYIFSRMLQDSKARSARPVNATSHIVHSYPTLPSDLIQES